MTNFRELGLLNLFAERLERMGITSPTAIQQEVFEPISVGKSVLGLSKTGTGKTFAYVLPLLQHYDQGNEAVQQPHPEVVVLVPTRELATQVDQALTAVTSSSSYGVVIVGGEAEEVQIRAAQTARWLLATPGRLLDLAGRNEVNLSNIKAVVFDEADRLLDMGFVDDMRAIVRMLPRNIQMLFFSATLHFGVDEMAYEFGVEFQRFGEEEDQVTVDGLDHRVAFVGDEEKFHALVHFIENQDSGRGIVFSNYRERAHEICARLRGLGCEAEGLTAQLSQGARTRIMEDFRQGKIRVLVASDLAARGLDIFDIDFVVNYDIPEDPAAYVHRVGRTARAGRKGVALSFVGFEDSFRLERLEKFIGHPIVRFSFPVENLTGRLPRLGEARQFAGEDRSRREGPTSQERPPTSSAPRTHQGPSRERERRPSQRRTYESAPPQPAPAREQQQRTQRPEPQPIHEQPKAKLSFGERVLNFVLGLIGVKTANSEEKKQPAPTPKSDQGSNARRRRPHTGRSGAPRGRRSDSRGGRHSQSSHSGRRGPSQGRNHGNTRRRPPAQ